MKTWIKRVVVIGAVLLMATACTPDQLKQWMRDNGVSYSHMSEAEINQQAADVTGYWNDQFDLLKFDWVLSDEQLYRLRWCESSDNYGAIGGRGVYRGAYQFNQAAWDGTARQFFPKYVGWDPATAPPRVQDSMTRALWSQMGPRPWPVCGYRV